MKLIFLGLSITSSWGNGHAVTYRGLCRALAGRGHRIVFYEWDAPWYSGAHRDLAVDRCDYATVRLYREWAEVRSAVRRDLGDADAVVLGSYVRDGIEVAEFLAQEFPGPRFFYDIDTPITVKAFRESGAAEYLRADQVPSFDVYFSFTGGPVLRELEARYGSPRARALYCAVDPEHYRRTAPVPWFRAALGYMGTYAADRQPALEELLVTPARRRPGSGFVVAGPQYPPRLDWPPNVWRIDHLPPAEHPRFYSSSRWTLNLTRSEMRRWGWSPSVRIFEAAACGAAIVSDSWEGLDAFLAPGKEVVVAETADEVEAALDLSDAEVRRIGEAARARILDHHTTAVRAAEFEREVEGVQRVRAGG